MTYIGEAAGVPSFIDLDGPMTITHGSGRYSYDEEVSSLQTSYGYASGGFAFVVALWAGQAFFHGKVAAGFTKRGWYSFAAWLVALAILMITSALIHVAFSSFHGTPASYIRMFLELVAAAGVGWASYQWFKNRVATLSGKSDA